MDSKIKIGVMDESVARLKGGPKVFMSRLKESIVKKDVYSDTEFNRWINLSFRKVPKFVKKNKERIQIIVRFDGVWNDTLIPNLFFPTVMDHVNTIVFKRINKVILDNYRLADKVIYQSEFSKFAIEKLLFERFKLDIPPKESTIVYNGVDLEHFKPMKECREKKNFPNILISHRLIPFKRAHQAPLIIEELIKKYPDLKVHIVGEGVKNPYHFGKNSKDAIRKEIKLRGLERHFEFYGHVDPDHLPKVYNKCDFMLNLSYADPCPNVVVEAMACGLPVIAPNHGGIPELVGDAQLLIDEQINMRSFQPRFIYRELPLINPNPYVEKIDNLLAHLPYYSEKMRARALEKFDISEVSDAYIEFVCR